MVGEAPREACEANYDARASVEPIQALLDQGCNFEMDVLPTVAGTVPELPRPLKNWARRGSCGKSWRRGRQDIGLKIAAPVEEGTDRQNIGLAVNIPARRIDEQLLQRKHASPRVWHSRHYRLGDRHRHILHRV